MLTNGGHDAGATGGMTMTADRSYTQLNDSPAAAAGAPGSTGSHLGCNGTCSAISRDTSMSTQVVVLSPATPTEAAVDEEGKGQITNSLRLAFAPS